MSGCKNLLRIELVKEKCVLALTILLVVSISGCATYSPNTSSTLTEPASEDSIYSSSTPSAASETPTAVVPSPTANPASEVSENIAATSSASTLPVSDPNQQPSPADTLASPHGSLAPDPAATAGAAPAVPSTSETGSAPEHSGKESKESVAEVNCKKVKCIALTIDDGPVAGTANVLDLFKEKGIPVTFFLLGKMVPAKKELVKRMVDEGHAVGNHSFDHAQFSRLSRAAIDAEISKTQSNIKKAGGVEPTLLRTPYGQLNSSIRQAAKAAKLPIIQWDIDPEDWKVRDTKTVIKRVVNAAHRNAIILTHDIWPTTRAAYEPIIDKLRAKGYVFVTIPQLLGSKLKPGKVAYHG